MGLPGQVTTFSGSSQAVAWSCLIGAFLGEAKVGADGR